MSDMAPQGAAPVQEPSTGWKIRGSLWVFLCVGTLGLASPWVVLVVAMRAGRRPWIAAAVLLCAMWCGAVAGFNGDELWQQDAASWLLLTVWMGSSAFAAGVNPQYLRIKWARRCAARAAAAAARNAAATRAASAARSVAAAARSFADTPRSAASSAPGPPAARRPEPRPHTSRGTVDSSAAEPVDINRAGPGEFAALPGFTPELAAQAVDQRTLHGPYRSVEQFAARLDLQPHVFRRVRDRLDCPRPAAPRPTFGRRVDW